MPYTTLTRRRSPSSGDSRVMGDNVALLKKFLLIINFKSLILTNDCKKIPTYYYLQKSYLDQWLLKFLLIINFKSLILTNDC